MRSVHPAASWDDVSVLSHHLDVSLYVSLKVVWWSLCPLLPAKNMNPILLAATWLPVRGLHTDCPALSPVLSCPPYAAQNYKTLTPSVAQPAHMLHITSAQEMWSAFSILVVTSIMGYDGISHYNGNDRNCVTLTDISLTEQRERGIILRFSSASYPASILHRLLCVTKANPPSIIQWMSNFRN